MARINRYKGMRKAPEYALASLDSFLYDADASGLAGGLFCEIHPQKKSVRSQIVFEDFPIIRYYIGRTFQPLREYHFSQKK